MTWNLDTALVTTFTLVRDNFAAFFAVALLFNAPSLIIGFVDDGFALALVVGIVAHILLTVCLTVGAIQAMAGARPSFTLLVQQIKRPDLGKLLALGIAQNVVIMLGLMAFIVPGLYVLSLWMVAMPALIVERSTVGGALDRSAALTRERRWLVLGIFVLVAIPAILVVEILGALTGIAIVTWLLEAALSTVLVSLTVVFYALLRGEKEGVKPQQIAAAVG
ncbi:MAG TPA: glycerophosphoryl diester phosphodiesterase membrane domain-containing protein [Reyranella sp.]|nr:glycerophosphoryl diester phosphodiesterase membrane domain-containing protein [Reyranella sp.]